MSPARLSAPLALAFASDIETQMARLEKAAERVTEQTEAINESIATVLRLIAALRGEAARARDEP